MERDRKQDDGFSRVAAQVFGPSEVFVPVPFVQPVQKQNGFVLFLFSGGGKYRIFKEIIFFNVAVGG